MSITTTTRRNLLRFGTTAAAYAAGASIVTGGIALASQATGAALTVSPQLAKLLTDRDAADAVLDKWYEAVWNPAVDRSVAIATAIPHVELVTPALPGSPTAPITWSTANSLSVGHARGIAGIPAQRQNQGAAWQARRRDARKFVAAHLRRERAIGQAGRETKILRVEEDKLWEPITRCDRAIECFPATSLEDLSAKLAHLEKVGSEPDGLLGTIQADVRRLLTQEAR